MGNACYGQIKSSATGLTLINAHKINTNKCNMLHQGTCSEESIKTKQTLNINKTAFAENLHQIRSQCLRVLQLPVFNAVQ